MAMKFGDNMCAIIPVRAGSKRVPDKNIRPFAGTNLLEIKIRQLLDIFSAKNIVVSTDCGTSAKIASDLGATVIWRPSDLASDTISMSDVYKHLAEIVRHEHILFTHVTNPLCDEAEYRGAISLYDNIDSHHDSITTITYLKDFIYTPNCTPLNFDPENKPRSQDLPKYFKLNHAISILPREVMISQKNIVGRSPYFLNISDLAATDIDTFLDFQVAEYIYNNQHARHP
jgi:N-acylneuraminate cytidylyltransferase